MPKFAITAACPRHPSLTINFEDEFFDEPDLLEDSGYACQICQGIMIRTGCREIVDVSFRASEDWSIGKACMAGKTYRELGLLLVDMRLQVLENGLSSKRKDMLIESLIPRLERARLECLESLDRKEIKRGG